MYKTTKELATEMLAARYGGKIPESVPASTCIDLMQDFAYERMTEAEEIERAKD